MSQMGLMLVMNPATRFKHFADMHSVHENGKQAEYICSGKRLRHQYRNESLPNF